MGKKQHQKDKMYLTSTEWSNLYGGYKASSHSGAHASFRRLPLTHCALSFQPFEHPFCDADGNVFELEALLPFLKKFKLNPVSGKPLNEKNLIKLKFHKAATGEYHCPVLYKPLTNSSHVVAVKTTGNVFCYEAVQQLNIKADNWRDLLSDECFSRADIITIQNPRDLSKFNISEFYHVKKGLRIEDEELVQSRTNSSLRLKHISEDAKIILNELSQNEKEEKSTLALTDDKQERVADKFNAAHYSTGKVAASFTSTTVDVATEHKPAVLEDDVVRYKRVKKKGYVSLKTNFGILNLEIYCDTVPKLSENFLRLCEKGYYNGLKFHRSIRHFMIQGGDPTGTGNGGESFWGKPLKDEIRTNLSHKGRGVLSMANSGPDTNKSQFFITFRSCAHLDGKHCIFGRVVGGLTTLSAIEAVETDNKDRPIEDIVIDSAVIFVDPFREADEELIKERRDEALKREAEEEELKVKRVKKGNEAPKVFRSGIGKFLDLSQTTVSKEDLSQTSKKRKDTVNNFQDFSCFS